MTGSSPKALHVAIDGRVIQDHFPGIGRYTYHLIQGLSEQAGEATFTVLVTPGQSDSRYDIAEMAGWPGVRLHTVDAPVFSVRSQWRVPAALRALRADVFHATYWVSAYRPGRPTVLSLYDLIGRKIPGSVPGWRGRLLELTLRLALRSSRHVLTLSSASARDLTELMAVPAERVTVTPLAADGRFHPMDADAVARLKSKLGLPARYVLYFGINKPHKNLTTLVEAWGRLNQASKMTPGTADPGALVIAGRWDPRYEAAHDLAQRWSSVADFRFLGPVPEVDLPTLYSGATAFAFPSRYEGFGLPPLEAMACGTPVVAADASSLPEVVGDAGILVGPDDVDGWATALGRLLVDPALAADLRARGLARAAGFTWAETARRTLAAYRRVAADRLDSHPGAP